MEEKNIQIKELISNEKIEARIAELGEKISEDYAGKDLHLVCILKGAAMFMCELAKHITIPVTMDFMAVSSYGAGTESSGTVKIVKDLDDSITRRNVLLVEDIVDSGRTLDYIKNLFIARNPQSVRICTFLDKPDRRVVDVDIDYSGFVVPDVFTVGYGLDYDQKYRNLPFVGEIIMEGKELS